MSYFSKMQCWPLPFFCWCVCSLHSHLLHSKFCLDIIYFAEIENCKHCNKIIFKCVNYAVWSIFNKKVAEKWNLWVHKQFMDALFTRELVKNYDCKKKKKEVQTWTRNVDPNSTLEAFPVLTVKIADQEVFASTSKNMRPF